MMTFGTAEDHQSWRTAHEDQWSQYLVHWRYSANLNINKCEVVFRLFNKQSVAMPSFYETWAQHLLNSYWFLSHDSLLFSWKSVNPHHIFCQTSLLPSFILAQLTELLKLENVAINNVLPLKVNQRDATAKLKSFWGFKSELQTNPLPLHLDLLWGAMLMLKECVINRKRNRILKVDKNSGPILSSLWTKVHKF